jgi:hypothetical protein
MEIFFLKNKSHDDKLLRKQVICIETFPKRKIVGMIFFPHKEIMLISYVPQNIIYKSYVHNFATL